MKTETLLPLTKRETQILKLLLAEYTLTEIGKVLNIHITTVHSAKKQIMKKWEVESMIGIVKEGIKRGYLELEDDEN